MNGAINKICGTKNVDYIIAVDTDSIYVNMGIIAQASGLTDPDELTKFIDSFCETKIQPFIDKAYKGLAETTNAREQAMHMKREAIADKCVFVAKKRYALNVRNNENIHYAEPELKIMGFECVRSSTPSSCRDAIKEAIRIMLQEDEQTLHRFVIDFRERFETLPFEDIAKNSSANGLVKYSDNNMGYIKGTPMHVRGALLYNKYIKDKGLDQTLEYCFDGEKLKFCYLTLPNPIRENVIAVPSKLSPSLGLDKYLDRDLQFEKTFLEPVAAITEVFGWTPRRINKVSSLWE